MQDLKFIDLEQSILEAQRFQKVAVELLKDEKCYRKAYTSADYERNNLNLNLTGRIPAAVKRASMDLSKALSQLRKG